MSEVTHECSIPTEFSDTLIERRRSRTDHIPSTILVIEDYADTRKMISALLRSEGYNVVEAEDGIEGVLKAGWLYPDLILMDLSLPEMDGVEAAARIHAQGKLARIPIFAVSAYLTLEVERDVRAAGCVEVFSKPIDTAALLAKIEARLKSA